MAVLEYNIDQNISGPFVYWLTLGLWLEKVLWANGLECHNECYYHLFCFMCPNHLKSTCLTPSEEASQKKQQLFPAVCFRWCQLFDTFWVLHKKLKPLSYNCFHGLIPSFHFSTALSTHRLKTLHSYLAHALTCWATFQTTTPRTMQNYSKNWLLHVLLQGQ